MPSKTHVALPLMLMALIYGISSVPGTPLPDNRALYSLFSRMSPTVQNILHVPAFAALALAWHWTPPCLAALVRRADVPHTGDQRCYNGVCLRNVGRMPPVTGAGPLRIADRRRA